MLEEGELNIFRDTSEMLTQRGLGIAGVSGAIVIGAIVGGCGIGFAIALRICSLTTLVGGCGIGFVIALI